MGFLTSFQLRSKDPATRARAARQLGVAGRTSGIPNLELLLQDHDAGVRRAAVQALGEIGGPSVVPLILDAVRRAGEARTETRGGASLRADAAHALAAAGQTALPALLHALGDKQPHVRECVAQALGRVGGRQAAEALGQALADDRSNVRQAAAGALALAAGTDAVARLSAAVSHKDPATRRAAAEALGTLHDPAAVAGLIQAMADRERGVRDVAVSALAAARTSEAIDALVGGLRGADRELRYASVAALRSCEWTPANATQRAAHSVLHGRYGEAATEGAAAVDFLVGALSEKDAGARRGAADALAQLARPETAEPLASLLSDPDAAVRDAGVRAVAAVGLPALPALLDSLEDRSQTTRASAAAALHGIGEDRAAACLLEKFETGKEATHGGRSLRIVGTQEAFEGMRHAADGLERLARHVAPRLPPARLSELASIADVLLVEPGLVPGSGDSLDMSEVRGLAARELSRRG